MKTAWRWWQRSVGCDWRVRSSQVSVGMSGSLPGRRIAVDLSMARVCWKRQAGDDDVQ